MPTVSQGFYKWMIWRGATLEDLADRLNHFWTFGLLLLFACIISWKQGYNKPISCWVPAQFTDSFNRYTEEICWNSYFITYPRDLEKANEAIQEMFNVTAQTRFHVHGPATTPWVYSQDTDLDDDLLTKMSRTRTVYQWLPIILCFQALFFKLPNLLMYIFHGYSGLGFERIARLTSGYQNMNLQERGVICRQVARYLFNWCGEFRNWLPWRLLTFLWLLVKVLYCVNVIVQMCLVDAFLKTTDPPIDNSTSYGDVIRGNLFENNATLWKFSPSFPRTVFCEFRIRQMHNIQNWAVQCQLTANYFNEFVYMLLWVWLLFVAIVTCLSLITWSLRTFIPIFRKRYIKKAIALSDDFDLKTMPPHGLDQFCDVIGEDGIMALKLIGVNTSELLVSNVVCNMWKLRTQDHGCLRPGQVLSVPEPVQSCAPVPSGSSNGTKNIEEISLI